MRFTRLFRLLSIALTFALILGVWLKPSIAQAEVKASVVLDGRSLFALSASGQYSAQERASFINAQLQETVAKPDAVQVTLEQRNQLPTVLVNDRYLLTVTSTDTMLGSTPETQAGQWAQTIRQAIQQAQQERRGESLRQMGLVAIGLLLLAIALHWILGKIAGRLSRIALRKILPMEDAGAAPTGMPVVAQSSTMVAFSFKLALALLRLGLWVSMVLYGANLFPWTRQWSYQAIELVRSSFLSPILTLGTNPYSLTDLLILAGVLLGWVLLAGLLSNVLKTRVLTLAGLGRGAQEAIAVVTRYLLIFLGTLVLLQVWGLDLSSLTILASALGIGIGLGLQNIAKNFSSGLVLVFERPIQVGDFIEVGAFKGTIERIGPRSTYIRTPDFVSIIVPNSRFLEEEVINWSHDTPMSRLHLPVGVAYGSDPKEVEAALMEVANLNVKVLQNPPPRVVFTGLGDSSLDFELLVWTEDPSKQFLLKSDLYFQIYEILCRKEIEIPFPQRDLHIRSSSLSKKQSAIAAQILLTEGDLAQEDSD